LGIISCFTTRIVETTTPAFEEETEDAASWLAKELVLAQKKAFHGYPFFSSFETRGI
jgi:hypothetical protein